MDNDADDFFTNLPDHLLVDWYSCPVVQGIGGPSASAAADMEMITAPRELVHLPSPPGDNAGLPQPPDPGSHHHPEAEHQLDSPDPELNNAAGGLLPEPDPCYMDFIDLLRANYERSIEDLRRRDQYQQGVINNNAGRSLQRDPWDFHRPWSIACKKFGSDEKTPSGYWKEKDNEFTAIRGHLWRHGAPVYVGLKRTLELYMSDGSKTDWTMNEFAMIHESDDGHLFLKEEVVISEVSKKKGKDGVLNPPTPRDMPNHQMNNIASHHDVADVAARSNQKQALVPLPSGKRLRSSDDPNPNIVIRISSSESEVSQHCYTSSRLPLPVRRPPGRRRRR